MDCKIWLCSWQKHRFDSGTAIDSGLLILGPAPGEIEQARVSIGSRVQIISVADNILAMMDWAVGPAGSQVGPPR